jgi:hypothetical protein
MYGMRCEGCGEVRWSILGRAEGKRVECPACGEAMVAERRRPGMSGPERAERRDLVVTGARVKLS